MGALGAGAWGCFREPTGHGSKGLLDPRVPGALDSTELSTFFSPRVPHAQPVTAGRAPSEHLSSSAWSQESLEAQRGWATSSKPHRKARMLG